MPLNRQFVRHACAEALSLVFPTSCAGCDEANVALCVTCRAALVPVVVAQPLVDDVEVFAGLRFEGAAARVMRAFKEDGKTSLARPLAQCLSAAIDAAVGSQVHHGDVRLVPIPSSRAAYRRRGFRPVDSIAHHTGYSREPLLRSVRMTADQRGLGVADRAHNLEESLRARRGLRQAVVVIDDVITTGATMREAVRALRAADVWVLGAAAVAATPRHVKRKGVSEA